MKHVLKPRQSFLANISGWMNPDRQDAIEYREIAIRRVYFAGCTTNQV